MIMIMMMILLSNKRHPVRSQKRGLLVVSGRRGMWLYKTGEVPPNPKAVCVSWFFRNNPSIFDRLVGFAGLPECPCSHRDVWRKTRYLWVKHSYDQSTKVQCYRMNRAGSNRHYPYGKVSGAAKLFIIIIIIIVMMMMTMVMMVMILST